MGSIHISERDSLAFDWELHSLRLLLQRMVQISLTAFQNRIPEPADADQAARQAEGLTRLPGVLSGMVDEYLQERAWWQQNKRSAPITELRQALLQKNLGIAVPIPEGILTTDQPEGVERREERWLLIIRSEVARRRMLCGQVMLIAEEAVSDHRFQRAYDDLRNLSQPPAYDSEEYTKQRAMTDDELADLVQRREHAAAAYRLTGHHTDPGWLS
jgi:hypothetical protein